VVEAEALGLDQQTTQTHKVDLVVVLVVIEQLVTDLVHYKDHHYHARQQEHIQLLWVLEALEVVHQEDHLVLHIIQVKMDQIHQ
jgi:hypothetical protein